MTRELEPVTSALRDHLDGLLDDFITVEVGERTVDPPAVVVQPLAGGTWLELIAPTWDDGEAPWQFPCVSTHPSQAEQIADKVRIALLDNAPPAGVKHIRPDTAGYGATPDRDVDPHLWESTPVFYLTV